MNTYDERVTKSKLFGMISELYFKNKHSLFIKKANKFLEIFPDDLSVYYMRGKVERTLKNFDAAIKDFEFVYNKDNRTNALVELFYLYYFLGKYNKAIELLPEIEKRNAIPSKKLKTAKLVLKTKLNMSISKDKSLLNDYYSHQIVDYKYDETIEHLKEHIDNTNEFKSQFNSNINLDYLLTIIKEYLTEENRCNEKASLDTYYFGMSGIGVTAFGDISNYIKVTVIPGTKNVVAAYPVNAVNEEVTNINYNREKMFSREKAKKKTLSQIEKFNRKYSKSI